MWFHFLARDADTLTGEPAARLQQYTAQIFRMYLDTKLKIARAELYEERDEDEQQDVPSDYVRRQKTAFASFLCLYLDSIRRAVGFDCQFRKVGRVERGKSVDRGVD